MPKIPMPIAPTNKRNIWNPYFYRENLGFSSILPFWSKIQDQFAHHWPTCDNFNALANESIHFCEQSELLLTSPLSYEWDIYYHQKVRTRLEHWHDFFNNLTWLIWPKIKWAIIQRSCQENKHSITRTPRQNLLAHFDECGIIICCDKPEYFELIREFQWKKFFWETKDLQQHCLPILFGHGLLEKLLSPYIGITAKAIFLPVSEQFFTEEATQNNYVDEAISNMILSNDFPNCPKSLHPFPFLGWPGWYPDNQREDFFNNTNYFRKGRR